MLRSAAVVSPLAVLVFLCLRSTSAKELQVSIVLFQGNRNKGVIEFVPLVFHKDIQL